MMWALSNEISDLSRQLKSAYFTGLFFLILGRF
jgi:hypothetical protein